MTNNTVDLYVRNESGILVMENTSITKTNVQETVQQEEVVSKQVVKIKLPLILSLNGAKTTEVVLTNDMTVSTALQQWSESMGDDSLNRKLFDKDGDLNANINVYVNGVNIKHEGKAGTVALGGGMATVLKADDQLDLLPAVAGG